MAIFFETNGKSGKAPDGNLTLALAEKFGRAPEEVERWDGYWYHRAATLIEGEAIEAENRRKRSERTRHR